MKKLKTQRARLEVDVESRSHGALDVDHLDVLPVLLEKRSQKVERNLDVGDVVLLGETHVTNSVAEAHNLLHLELDLSLDLVDLVLERLAGAHNGGELTSTVKTGAEQTGDLLDECLRSNKGIVLASQLLYKLLVLVELLEVIDRHEGKAKVLCTLAVKIVTENAYLHVGARYLGELEGASETLVLAGIVVLEGYLKIEGLDEVTLLAGLLLAAVEGDGLTIAERNDAVHSGVEDFIAYLSHLDVLDFN